MECPSVRTIFAPIHLPFTVPHSPTPIHPATTTPQLLLFVCINYSLVICLIKTVKYEVLKLVLKRKGKTKIGENYFFLVTISLGRVVVPIPKVVIKLPRAY